MIQLSDLWDLPSFIIVWGGSLFVWLIQFALKRKWSDFTQNISLILGVVYGVFWEIQLFMAGNRSFILCVALIPIFYGILLKLLFHLVIYIRRQQEKLRKQEEIERQYNEQKKAYFALMLEKENETRRFRHDILNHLLCMQDQLEREQYVDAKAYLDSVLNELNTIREMQYDVGNEVVNVLLNYYLLPIRERCNVSIEGYLGKMEHISQMDLCTIVSNLLKNAAEAVNAGGKIEVLIARKQKFAQVQICNSCVSIPQIDKTGELETTKMDKENHGYGLENVRKTVQKNHGQFEYYVENECFCVRIVLPV